MKPLALLAFLVLLVAALGTSLAGHEEEPTLPEHPAGACTGTFHLQHAGWDLCWQQDDARAQGIELNQVYFHDERILWKIGFPLSITRYDEDAYGPFKDTLGRSIGDGDNPGFGRGSMAIHPTDCPRFLGLGVLLNNDRICVEKRKGPEPALTIWARYDIFNYRFLQGYTLDSRGVLEPFVRLGGLLIDGDFGGASSTNHFHHLYWRTDFDVAAPGNDAFQVYLRPEQAWNDWAPRIEWTPTENETMDPKTDCSQFPQGWTPPPCRNLKGDGEFNFIDPLEDLPAECRQQVLDGLIKWCSVTEETAFVHHPSLFTKWRVRDTADTNRWGNEKSFESTGQTQYDVPVDGEFTTFNTMVLQHQGDSREIGFEVPAHPTEGDTYLRTYMDLPETIEDPVVWIGAHVYHDTRDEEKPTMAYHHVSFKLEPRNLLAENPGEDTYAGSPLPSPPGGIEPGECLGPVCT